MDHPKFPENPKLGWTVWSWGHMNSHSWYSYWDLAIGFLPCPFLFLSTFLSLKNNNFKISNVHWQISISLLIAIKKFVKFSCALVTRKEKSISYQLSISISYRMFSVHYDFTFFFLYFYIRYHSLFLLHSLLVSMLKYLFYFFFY